MFKNKKRNYILGSIVFIVFLILFFLSSIIKSYVIKNSNELIGRKLTLDELHINYIKVKITARNFTLYEQNERDTFVYFKELVINYDPWKMLSNEYAVSQIRLADPYVYIKQNGEKFNFDDLIPPADTGQIKTDTIASENNNVKFSIRNIDLENGEFHYYDQQIDNLLDFDNLNLELPLIAWNSQSSEMGVQFSIGEQGLVKIDADINQQEARYNLYFGTERIQLNSFTNYLKDYVYISELKGLLNTNLHINGSIDEVNDIKIYGSVSVDSLDISDNLNNTLVKASRIESHIDTLDLKNMQYTINKIRVDEPFIAATLNPEQSNWEYFLTPISSDTLESELADTTSTSLEDSISLFYQIDTIQINKGLIQFTDNTLNRDFKYNIRDINVTLSKLNPQNDQIPLKWSMKFNNEGKYTGETLFSMNNPLNLNYKGNLSNLDLHSFSPYTEYYLAYPIVSGLFSYNASIEMNPSKLKNDNHLLVNKMEFGKRTKDSTASKLPVKLALYLIKDSKDNVEFELPVTGNPSEPGFKLGPLIWKTFGKFIAKTAAQPFGSLAKLIGTTPEELEMIPFDYTQDSLLSRQKETLDKIAEILTKKEDLIFSFRQEVSVEDEIKQLAVKQVKSRYISEKNPANIVNWQDIKDSDENFLSYLNNLSSTTIGQAVEQRCQTLVSNDELQTIFKNLYSSRKQLLKNYLINVKSCDPTSIKSLDVDFKNMPQDLKKPGFRVEVSVK